MEELFQDKLEKGEKILWLGKPEAFETLDKTNRRSVLTATVVKAAVTLCLLVAYTIAARNIGDVKPFVFVLILAIAAFAIAMPFMTARHLRRGAVYAITDRNIYRTGNSETSVPLSRIHVAALKLDSDGHTTLLCGPEAQKYPPTKWRTYADISFRNMEEEDQCERAVIYALPMDDELKKILHQVLPLD